MVAAATVVWGGMLAVAGAVATARTVAAVGVILRVLGRAAEGHQAQQRGW